MSEDQVIVAFKQWCKDERTAEKLATKNLKTVAKLNKILNATAKIADAQAQMHGHSDAEDKKEKNKVNRMSS